MEAEQPVLEISRHDGRDGGSMHSALVDGCGSLY